MKQVIISWGFSQHTGDLYLDCYLEITDAQKDATAVKMIELRGSSQGTHLALVRIPKDCERDYIESLIKDVPRKEIIALLNKAKIRASDVLRKGDTNQAIDFIKYA